MTQTSTKNGTQKKQETPARQERSSEEMKPLDDIVEYAKRYAREKPDVAAAWCFGIGFLVGWKIKPW